MTTTYPLLPASDAHAGSSLLLRRSSPADRGRIRDFLVGLSADTLYQRFLTGMAAPSPALVDHLATGGYGAALLAEADGLVVGHGLWAPDRPDADGRATAEIAVVVADGHQRRGVGTTLVQALLGELGRHGFDRVRVVTNADNRAVRHMVAWQDPTARAERDGPTWSYDLAVPTTGRRPGRPEEPGDPGSTAGTRAHTSQAPSRIRVRPGISSTSRQACTRSGRSTR